MTRFNAQRFFISLSEEDAKIVMGFASPEELEAFIRERNIDASEYFENDDEELSAEQLDGVSGGKGLLPAALASLMLFTTVGNIAASADGAPANTAAVVSKTDFRPEYVVSFEAKTNFGMGEFDWGGAAKGISEKLLNKGVSALFENIPVVGEMFADPVCDLITTALGLKEDEVKLEDIDKKLDTVIEDLHELKDKLDDMNEQVNGKLDTNTQRILEEIRDQNSAQSAGAALLNLHNKLSDALAKLDCIDGLSREDKIVVLAQVTGYGSGSSWSSKENLLGALKDAGSYLSNPELTGDKRDLFELSYDIAKKHYMFNKETIEAVDSYIAKVMAEYMTAYAVAMASLDAHRTLITASPEEFDPENILDKTNRRWYDSNFTTTTDVSSNISRLAEILNGNGNDKKDSIFYSYDAFNARSKTAYINKGQETREMFLASHTCLDGEGNFASFFKNGSLPESEIADIVKLAKEKGMSIRQYLEYNGQEVPAEAKYLMTSGVKTKDENRWSSAIGACHDMTKYVEAIELDDEKCETVELAARTYWTAEDPTETGERNEKKFSYTFLSFAEKKNVSAAAPLGSAKEMENGLYKLASDYKMDKGYVIASGRSVTIDLNGFKLDRGLANASESASDGYHFKVEKGAHLTIIDTKGSGVLTGGYAVKGGAVNVAKGGSLSVLGGSINGNRSKEQGGAIYNEGKVYISHRMTKGYTSYGSEVANNTSRDGGAIFNTSSGTIEAKGSVILRDNRSTDCGGGAVSNFGTLKMGVLRLSDENTTTIYSPEVRNNTANTRGGGIWSSGDLELDDVTVSGNKTGIDGGGLYLSGKGAFNNVTITNCTISGNTCQYGAGVYVEKAFTTKIANTVINDNHASINGGGIFMSPTIYGTNFSYKDLKLTNVDIVGNSARNMGGGIYSLGVIIVNDGNIKGNTANKGAGVCSDGGRSGDSRVTLYRTRITENKASDIGGGVYNGGKGFVMENIFIEKNEARSYGGGFYNDGQKIERDATFMSGGSLNNNRAGKGCPNDCDWSHVFWVKNGGNVNGKAFY